MTDTQTVATTDAETKSQTEGKGAQEPSIDDLLKEFDTTDNPTEQQSADLKADDIKEFVRTAKEDREERIREKTDADVSEAVKTVKGDLEIDDGLVKELLYGKASTDPRFLKAFQMRRENPDAWGRVQKAFNTELVSKLSPKTDQNLTDDRAAVEAAVRSHSTGSPDETPPDFNSMSDAEFNAWQRKNIK